ncbi:MAG: hypothetical protein HY013_06500, partial [Candidatus Solibacter usitatus]|nr:hypothetical protein [Candidatus Solibacter usitatus]
MKESNFAPRALVPSRDREGAVAEIFHSFLRSRLAGLFLALLGGAAVCLAVEVGSGAPTAGLTYKFLNAYFRNGFNNLVSLPPIADVQRFGPTGLVQEFRDAAKTSGVKMALVKFDMTTALPTGRVDIAQVYGDMYAYYNSVGVATAGYPITDTAACPDFTGNSCQYQFFDKSYVLFAHKTTTFNGQNFTVRQNFYTKWVALGGIDGLGRATDIERAVTSTAFSTNATVQEFAGGTIFSITSGTLNGRVFSVAQPILGVYLASGGPTGFMGMPSADEITLPSGRHRQTFQGGSIEFDPGVDPVLLLPVATVALTPTSSGVLRMKLADTVQLTALTLAANGANLTGRVVTWSTSNNRVVSIQASGATAQLKAVGGGSAFVSASSEGKSSTTLSVVVTAPCCQVGEGAPSSIVQQSFQDAVTRNRLSIALPAQNPVRRAGAGYVQDLMSTGNPPVRYLLAKPDRVSTTYLVTGELLVKYEQLGGPAGSLGHPLSDATAAGRQLFENGALAGSPARRVSGAILSKWAILGYETGLAGAPVADAATLLSSSAVPAIQQAFAKGAILGAVSGPRAGQSFFVSGLILARYNALSGVTGTFGLPVSDEFGADGRRRQNFEGGYIDYAPGDTAASDHAAERRPAVSAAPVSVVAGARLRLAVSGFDDGATLRVSIGGQPDFLVATANGAYAWETFIPLTAPAATVTVRAVDESSGASAETSYVVKSLASSRLQVVKLRGDGQVGAPGVPLAQPLSVAVRDENGVAIVGAAVLFTASPGAQIQSASAATDENGEAAALVRMPAAEGVALVTAESMRAVATFSMRVTPLQLPNYPRFSAPDRKDSLLAAMASVLRYHQNRNELPGAPVDPAALAQFLKSFCVFDADGNQICDGFLPGADPNEQVANPWRAAGLVGGQLDVQGETADPAAIRDLVAQGSPVLLALSLAAADTPAGGHFVVATGIAGDGSLLIFDPNPVLGRANLNEYFTGFDAGGQSWKGVLAGALRLVPRAPSATGFLLASFAQPAGAAQRLKLDVDSAGGSCGRTVDLPDVAPPAVGRFRYCDGAQAAYQLTIGGGQTYKVAATDFAQGGRAAELAGGGVSAYRATRPGIQLQLGPQEVSFTAGSVVNAATLQPGIAPNGLMVVFGNGLASPDAETTVELGGVTATVVTKSPFQVTAVAPPGLPPGTYPLRIRSAFGVAEQQVEVRDVAPAIFMVAAEQPAVANQDGRLNTHLTPVRRGQALVIYATGLGAVTQSGSLAQTQTPVSAVLGGMELPVAFAGLAPGLPGVYQVNLVTPAQTPPGLKASLLLRQGAVDSNTVFV